ncbi:hypothetical protein FO519_000238 [Halicephalobus sp. NKZ332]|nr:hypothetical protein FO519_000238 [Halicephalobus sp. NKZ332]
MKILNEAAEFIKGEGTLAFVDCIPKTGQKLCKLLKGIAPEKVPFIIKYYKNGEFNKVYDRQFAAETIERFMRDPDGPIPYADEPGAEVVLHPYKKSDFQELLQISPLPVLTMFYAPWCGYCKKLKPHFSEAAKELMGEAILVAVDLTQDGNKPLGHDYKISGYPTLIRFHKGKQVIFEGERTKEKIVAFAKDPTAAPEKKKVSEDSFFANSDVVLLNDETFDDFVSKNPSIGVMFFAPWCGHCKNVKPEYEKAAEKMKKDGINGVLAAVDATVSPNVAGKYEIRSYPSFLYFKDGKKEFKFDERTSEKIVKFMKKEREIYGYPTFELIKEGEKQRYTGPRGVDDFVSFVNFGIKGEEEQQPQVAGFEFVMNIAITTPETFDDLVKIGKRVIMYFDPEDESNDASLRAFNQAAELTDPGTFVVVDCNTYKEFCKEKRITKLPTFHVYNKGRFQKSFKAENKEMLIAALSGKDYTPPLDFGPNVKMATHLDFYQLISGKKSLVFFFAPWCGHCKQMKPEFIEAAARHKSGLFIAIDCTIYQAICKEYDVTSFPTFILFSRGQVFGPFKGSRSATGFVAAFSKTKEQLKPDKEDDFSFVDEIQVATEENFDEAVSGKRTLVMFFTPRCGHCKTAKAEYNAAAILKKDGNFAAVDCTQQKSLCKKHGVTSFPTFLIFEKGT